MAEPSNLATITTLPSSPKTAPLIYRGSNHPVHQTLATANNLANLLPTGTVLAFQTFIPSFSNNGNCQISNKCLTSFLITFLAILCFLSSFTDSFKGSDGKLYYGIATFKGLYIFNCNNNLVNNKKELEKFKLSFIDFVHAFVSLLVFLIFALSNSSVQTCFFSHVGNEGNVLIMNLPMAAGALSSFFFTIFPTIRRGVGFADMETHS